MLRFLALVALAGVVAAAPLAPEKLGLIPGLFPKQRRELAQKMRPFFGKEGARDALVEAGVDARIAARLEELAPGPLLVERYAHGLVFDAPGLTEQQKALLDYLHPSVLAAQFALWVQRQNVLDGCGLEKEDPLRARLQQSFDRQIREIEKRYWRIVGYVLTVDQRAALHPLMPEPYQRPPNLQGHVYQAPGMTPSQASRIRALVTEYEAESGADTAEVRRQQARARDATLPAEERQAAQRDVEAATDRLADLAKDVIERGRAILTPDQIRHLDALPPLLSPQERAQNPGDLLKQMGLDAEQQQRVQALAADVVKRVQEARQKAEEQVKDLKGEVGSDSPQAMTMQMMQQGVQAEQMLAMEEAAHTAFLEIVEKKAVLGWILNVR